MKKTLIDIAGFIQGIIGFVVLRPYCVDGTLRSFLHLTDYGFHVAFENNPQIIFQRKEFRVAKLSQNAVIKSCKWVKLFVERRLWMGKWQQMILHLIGVSEPLCSSLNLLLRPTTTCGYNDQKDYDISPSAVKPEGKIAVYSVLTGHYDSIKDPIYVTPGVDYLLFTNCEVKTKVWKVIKVDSNGLSNLLLSRRIKMLPWEYLPEGYDYSVYVDANVIIWGDITMLTTYLSDKISLAVTAHSVRRTVKSEFDEVTRLGMVDEKKARVLYDSYVSEGFIDDYGLAECTVLVRIHSDIVLKNTMQSWWNEFSKNGVHRDQLSIMYCIWKERFNGYMLLDAHVMNNQFCTTRSHTDKCCQHYNKDSNTDSMD